MTCFPFAAASHRYLKALGLTIAALCATLFAAVTPSHGVNSADVNVGLFVSETVKISKISGFEGISYTGSAAGLNLTDDICIYSNMLPDIITNKYKVQIDGSYPTDGGAVAGFKLSSTVTDQTVDFNVYWNDQSATNTGESAVAASGNELTSQTGWSQLLDCGGGADDASHTTARLHITASQADLLSTKAGTYSNTLTILVTATP